jgi:hypothetical protein
MPDNILFLMTDQHSVSALGAYGNPIVRTPALDRLAATGTRFAWKTWPTGSSLIPVRCGRPAGRWAWSASGTGECSGGVAARTRNAPDAATGNLGFRCVADAGSRPG